MVLDVLARRGVKATFFVVGNKLAESRAPAERAAREGHWIGNHTWSHSYPFRDKGDAAFVRDEIDRTQTEIGALSHASRLFRPFGGGGQLQGALNSTAADHLQAGGYTCVTWNAVPGDWKNQDGWPAVATEQIHDLAWPLVVLHDIHAVAMRHLDRFIGLLQDQGHAFRQDFPPDCVVIREGMPTKFIDGGILDN